MGVFTGRGLKSRAQSIFRRTVQVRKRLPSMTYESLTGESQIPRFDDVIFDDICMPPYLGDKSFNDFPCLMGIARWLRPNTILELGTAYGNTVANLCKFVPEARVVTVNAKSDSQSGVLTTYDLSESEIGRVYRKHGYGGRVVQVFEDTMTMDIGNFVSGQIDLAIVDACHDFDFVLNDFHKTVRYMRPGGIVLLHDTHPSLYGHLFHSYTACLRLREQGINVQHLSGTSWGIFVAT
jgi:hypothetical protein